MFAQLNSLGLLGVNAYPVLVETDFSRAMPSLDIVGLPDASVRESRDRIKAALSNCSFSLPPGRIVVNLAPADVKKCGTLYDLPIFVGLLLATGQLSCDTAGQAFLGELSLSGEVRPVAGVLPLVLGAREQGLHSVFLPAGNAAEGAVVEGISVYSVSTAKELLAHLRGERRILPAKPLPRLAAPGPIPLDFRDVKGQPVARRAAEIAAAGGHNMLLIGSPGAGKSMIARRIPSILPLLTFEEAIEATKIHSVAGMLPPGGSLLTERPFRAPHHTVSPAGLSGGGGVPRPGEISLAHEGVLFLDELPEFSRTAMEVLRQPLENGVLTISRAAARLSYPSEVMLVAAMNPCPCGYFGHPTRVCTCSGRQVSQYIGRVSGPLLDRIDLHVEVLPVEFDSLTENEPAESSADIRKRVVAARERQTARAPDTGVSCNARLASASMSRVCQTSQEAKALLRRAFESMGLSARAYDRILKVSKTIADLDGSPIIEKRHIAEAVQYRSLDRKYWQRETQ